MLNKKENILQCFQNSYLAVWHPLNLTPYYFGTIYFGTHKPKSIRILPLVSQCPRDTAPYIFFIIFLYSYFIVFIFYKIYVYDTALYISIYSSVLLLQFLTKDRTTVSETLTIPFWRNLRGID